MSLSNATSNSLSQQRSPAALNGLLTMPLGKFSYATTLALQSKPIWTHLPDRDNMFAVFDLVSSMGSGDDVSQRNVLKVVRASDLVESIDLDDLQPQVLKDDDCAASMGLQDADRLVLIIHRAPLVAIRYPLPHGQVRRIQMKFAQAYDYTMAVRLLQRLKLPIRASAPIPRPHTTISNGYSRAQSSPASALLQPQEENISSQRGKFSALPAHDPVARSSSVMLESSPFLGSSQIFRANSTSSMPRGVSFQKELTGAQRSLNADLNNDGNLDQLLPPKRELPFAKAKSKLPSKDALLTQQPTSSLDPLSLSDAVGIKRPAKKTKANHLINPASESLLTSTDRSAVESSENILSSSYRPSAIPVSTTFSSTEIPSSSPPMAYAVNSCAPTFLVPAGGNQSEPGQPKNPIEQITNPKDNEVSDEYFARIDTFIQKHHNRPLGETYFDNAAADRAAFAALPDAERLAAIDTQIMECVMDDGFLQLCEDVEKSWKRIALGF
ncbi:MAG: hypothetical protein FRX48_03059 [Lasallia pustulata]|uniref:Uncharacterized protein n=1 Tax=Lasallia pustulata TaxID=136370 RepID=A0A5M8PX66_9LECA|nr:MAG: hypothetical protein FRX48_03059 [Lasallia pustulata]